ncbi:zinc-binding protein A33-like [Leucoraja erinacea]|uniref:zinc-binding protein A33-like n=1 Tax=Leucoraja erinaceus TaxID=7782 RepID=UPI002458972E|nr:zinc-binding protein A33-like [Leucoraja erinacea]
MAANDQVESWTAEIICPICLNFFSDPVSLECGHNFCRSCITQSWDRERRNSCPECKEEFTDRTLRVNRALARLSEKARTLSLIRTEKARKLQCEDHQEELKLFCETDKKLICVICAAGQEHKAHNFTLITEAAELYKDQVKASFQSLTKKESEIQQMEQQQKQKISGVLEQSHNLQSEITSQFAEQHQILTEKEQRVLADIQEKEKKILNTMEKNLGEIEGNLKSIQQDLFTLQQHLDQKDSVVFLKEETGCKRRIRDEAKPLSVVDEALQVEKFLCPVSLNKTFKEISVDFKQVSITLDMETAHPWLDVSEDRRRVRWTRTRRSLPDTGKRFTGSLCVLGLQGFVSGKLYWEVEVTGSHGWRLGVATDSVERKRLVTLTPETGVWSLGRWGDAFDALTSPTTPLPTRPIPGRVGVYLNYESGTISFYNGDTKSHLHTFTGNKFTEKLYPFFWPCDGNWLRICSVSETGV